MSPKLLLVSSEDALEERYLRGHWALSSVGDGCSMAKSASRGRSKEVLMRGRAYRKIDAAIIDNCWAKTMSAHCIC